MGPGDVDEAAAYCARVRPWLVGSLSLYCGDADVAEELAQDALARVWDRWRDVRAMAAPEAWTYRVALNLASSHYRRRAAEKRAVGRDAALRSTTSASADTADAIAIRQAVSGLPRRQKAALVLRYYADLPVAQVADLLGCAPGTVKALTHQALLGMRASISDEALVEVSDEA